MILNSNSDTPLPCILKKYFILFFFFQDYCPDLGMYNHEIGPLDRSKPKFSMEDLLEATEPMAPFPWSQETDMKIDDFEGVLASLIRKFFSMFK